jgi:hypothetical protein
MVAPMRPLTTVTLSCLPFVESLSAEDFAPWGCGPKLWRTATGFTSFNADFAWLAYAPPRGPTSELDLLVPNDRGEDH